MNETKHSFRGVQLQLINIGTLHEEAGSVYSPLTHTHICVTKHLAASSP